MLLTFKTALNKLQDRQYQDTEKNALPFFGNIRASHRSKDHFCLCILNFNFQLLNPKSSDLKIPT